MFRLAAVMLTLAIACSGAGLLAQGAASHPDLSGYWELRLDSFNVPRAALTPQAQAATNTRLKNDLEAIRGCVNIGVPALMNDHSTLDIRYSPAYLAVDVASETPIDHRGS